VLTRALCGALALFVASAATAQPRVDLALINGTVITVDGRNTVAQAIAVGGGAIVAVGTSAEIERPAQARGSSISRARP
jgi:predicted amidohydrolase YtcJ